MIYSAQQLRTRKLSKRFVDFNVLLIGENRIGKKSFMNTLCQERLYLINLEPFDYQNLDNNKVFSICTDQHILKCDSLIRLSVHRTKNFGYSLDSSQDIHKIRDFLDYKFETRFVEETKVSRNKRSQEDVVHLVILFINPLMKGLKPLEIELIKNIQWKCNLLVCVAKSDLLNYKQLQVQKQLIQTSIDTHGLKIFNFADLNMEECDDGDLVEYYNEIQGLVPFSIINSNEQTFQKRISIAFEINIDKYSETKVLRDIIFNLNLAEFKELTSNVIYELYRTEKLLLK